MVKVHKCKECQQTFLSWKEFDAHVGRHLQNHLDEYTPKIPEKRTPWESFSNIPEDMNRDLLKVFEKYNLGDKSMLCLWRNGYLSCALRERSREQELQTRVSEWLTSSTGRYTLSHKPVGVLFKPGSVYMGHCSLLMITEKPALWIKITDVTKRLTLIDN